MDPETIGEVLSPSLLRLPSSFTYDDSMKDKKVNVYLHTISSKIFSRESLVQVKGHVYIRKHIINLSSLEYPLFPL